MKNSYRITDLPCPHCGTKNAMVCQPPRGFADHGWTIKCWDAEAKKGCLKYFVVITRTQILTTKTKEQQDAEAKAVIKTPTPEQQKQFGQ